MPISSSARPHDPGNDYFAPGIYLITLVVRGRKNVLGHLNMDAQRPDVVLSQLGLYIKKAWDETPEYQASKGRKLRVLAQAVMPDHWHTVIEVLEPMDKSLGGIIQGFKCVCTSQWRKLRGVPAIKSLPCTAETIRRMSRPQRAVFYASPEGEPFAPLFDDDYDDTICLKVYDNLALPSQSGLTQPPQDPASLQHSRAWHYDQRHLDAMVQYVEDNPRRAIVRKLYPQFMTRCMHVWIAGRDYGAFGNLALLKWPDKRAVIVHRKAQPGQRSETGGLYPYGTPYEKTVQFELEKQTLLNDARSGQCVLVSAGISEGEKQIRNAALMEHLPFIHLQKESFGMLWKPEKSRFEACAQGTLLILAPWHVDGVLAYDQFHNLNQLAQEISECNLEIMIRS